MDKTSPNIRTGNQGKAASVINRLWYQSHPLNGLLWPVLWPLSVLFRLIAGGRRLAYKKNWLKSYAVSAPIVVVGNIVAGGSGKTPLLIGLVERLQQAGYQPGIISRGYGGRSKYWPRHVDKQSDPAEVGDEPVLLARRCGCPIVVAPDRVAAAQTLLRDYACDIVLSDDGLQHYRLQRAIEIVVIDAKRGFGNGFCLPLGPLREPPDRLDSVDFVIQHCSPWSDLNLSPGSELATQYSMKLQAGAVINIIDPDVTRMLSSFAGETVHAVAAIGHPERFFEMLRRTGIDVIAHAFPDHHHFSAEDISFNDEKAVLMTEKDAVKCSEMTTDQHWYVRMQTQLTPLFEKHFSARLGDMISPRQNLQPTDEPERG